MVVSRVVRVLAGLALLGCGRDKPAARDSAAVGASAPAAAATGGTCARTGHWGDCQIRARLAQSGLAPRGTSDKVGDLPALDVKPVTMMLGNAGLAVYFFPDTVSRHRAAATLDTARYIAQTRPVSMKSETTLIQNDNALVLLFSRNEHQRERVADAITAGAPQP